MAVMYVSYSFKNEGEAIKESVVRGHHIFKEVWRPVIGQELPVFSEPNNHHDRRVVAIYIDCVLVGMCPEFFGSFSSMMAR